MSDFAKRNAKTFGFFIGLILVLTLSKEALVLVYLTGGFIWFIVWLVSGNHASEPKAAKQKPNLMDGGMLAGPVNAAD